MTRNWLGAAVFLAMAAAGCGGGGGTTAVTPATFCAQVADKECQVTTKCGIADKTACTTVRAAKCMAQATERAVAPRVFTVANINNCVNQVNSVYSTNGMITVAKLDAMDDACQYVFQGNIKEGKDCTVKYDCEGTLICDTAKSPSLCAKKVVKNMGDLCGNPGEVCNTGSYCTKMGDVFRCVAKLTANQACDVDANPCVEALRCLAGTCQTRADSGGACTSDDDCATTVPYCDPYIGNKCDQGLTFGGGAAACAAFGGSGSGGGTGGASGTGGNAGGTGGASGSDAGSETGGGDDASTD
jgi:hypothetical protein